MCASPQILTGLLLLLLCYPSAHAQRQFFGTKLKLSEKMQELVRIQRVKESILRGLNMTNAPPSTRQITPVKPTSASLPAGPPEKQVQVVFSEARDDQRPDMLTFKLDSGLVAKMDTIKSVYLQIQFRTKRRGKRNRIHTGRGEDDDDNDDDDDFNPAEDGANEEDEKSVKEKDRSVTTKHGRWKSEIERTGENDSNTLHETHSDETVDKSNTRRGNKRKKWRARRGRKARMRRLQSRRVKLVVKVVDPNSDKKRKFSVKRFDIKRTHIANINIPLPLLGASAAAPSHSLTFQIVCKRCKKGVRWEKVYKQPRNKRKLNMRRLNPNRPMLYIESKDGQNELSSDRRKRTVSKHCAPDFDVSADEHSDMGDTCCSEKVYVPFHGSQLAHVILFPPGIYTVFCQGSCNDADPENEWQEKNHQSEMSDYHDYHSDSLSSVFNMDGPLVKTKAPSLATKGSRQCVPVQKTYIDVIYVDERSNILSKRIEDVVDLQCGCAISHLK